MKYAHSCAFDDLKSFRSVSLPSFYPLLYFLITEIIVKSNNNVEVGTLLGLSCLLLVNACGLGSVSRFYSAELVPRHLLLNSVALLTIFEAIMKIALEFSFYPIANIVSVFYFIYDYFYDCRISR